MVKLQELKRSYVFKISLVRDVLFILSIERSIILIKGTISKQMSKNCTHNLGELAVCIMLRYSKHPLTRTWGLRTSWQKISPLIP